MRPVSIDSVNIIFLYIGQNSAYHFLITIYIKVFVGKYCQGGSNDGSRLFGFCSCGICSSDDCAVWGRICRIAEYHDMDYLAVAGMLNECASAPQFYIVNMGSDSQYIHITFPQQLIFNTLADMPAAAALAGSCDHCSLLDCTISYEDIVCPQVLTSLSNPVIGLWKLANNSLLGFDRCAVFKSMTILKYLNKGITLYNFLLLLSWYFLK